MLKDILLKGERYFLVLLKDIEVAIFDKVVHPNSVLLLLFHLFVHPFESLMHDQRNFRGQEVSRLVDVIIRVVFIFFL